MNATIEIDGLRRRFGTVQARPSPGTWTRSAPCPPAWTPRPRSGLKGLPLTPWQGLGVVALWTAAALLLGALVLKLRDA
jgi:hypothetical protein